MNSIRAKFLAFLISWFAPALTMVGCQGVPARLDGLDQSIEKEFRLLIQERGRLVFRSDNGKEGAGDCTIDIIFGKRSFMVRFGYVISKVPVEFEIDEKGMVNLTGKDLIWPKMVLTRDREGLALSPKEEETSGGNCVVWPFRLIEESPRMLTDKRLHFASVQKRPGFVATAVLEEDDASTVSLSICEGGTVLFRIPVFVLDVCSNGAIQSPNGSGSDVAVRHRILRSTFDYRYLEVEWEGDEVKISYNGESLGRFGKTGPTISGTP